MKEIYVNLKRFEVPRSAGGLAPLPDPVAWIQMVMRETVEAGLGEHEELQLVYLLPEGLIPPAQATLADYPEVARAHLALGCQGVHWEDIEPGGNFGAFTGSLPATAARYLGATWAIIGHSEERRAKQQVMAAYAPAVEKEDEAARRAGRAVDALLQAEMQVAAAAGLNLLFCVGESAAERGEGTFAEQQPRIREVLRRQLETGLRGVVERLGEQRVVIGYEPIWAIGPGRTPPGAAYISFVGDYVKEVVQESFGLDPVVVYGGGLKEENAAMIAGIDAIGGGLVALTRFSGEIGFDVSGLQGIVEKYLAA